LCALFDSRAMVHELRVVSDSLLVHARGGADVLVDRAPVDAKVLQLAHLLYPDAIFVHASSGREQDRADAAAARTLVETSRVPHTTLSIEAVLADPDVALQPILARVGASGPLAPRLRGRLDELLVDARHGTRGRSFLRRVRRRLGGARRIAD
jgi:hypothetical protein